MAAAMAASMAALFISVQCMRATIAAAIKAHTLNGDEESTYEE